MKGSLLATKTMINGNDVIKTDNKYSKKLGVGVPYPPIHKGVVPLDLLNWVTMPSSVKSMHTNPICSPSKALAWGS